MHVRQQIAVAVAATLANLATTKAQVFVGRVYPLATSELPALVINVGDELVERATVGFPYREAHNVEVVIEAAVQTEGDTGALLNTILAQVQTALNASIASATAGGLLRQALYLDGLTVEADDQGDNPIGRLRMSWRGVYHTMSHQPEVAL
jgi:hypothetical protein